MIIALSSDMVQLLVSYGATVDIRGGSDSWTPLFYAAMAGTSCDGHMTIV